MIPVFAAVAMFLQPSPAMLRQVYEQELPRCRTTHGASDRRTARAASDLALFLVRQGATADGRAALSEAIRPEELALARMI